MPDHVKGRILALVLLLLTASCAVSQTPPAPRADCSIKPEQLDTLLALPMKAFDQDHAGGWRELEGKGCEVAAAMLIDTYLVDSQEELKIVQLEDLYFHAGQLYAMAGLRTLAARRILRSINLHEGANEDLAWNTYAIATIAFLQGDREELAHRRQQLTSAKPTRENKINLSVIDGLVKCFDKPYGEAYSLACRAPVQ